MPVPDSWSLMLPVLRWTARGDIDTRELASRLADELGLTAEERHETLRNGSNLFRNRIAWALVYLGMARLVERKTRGIYRITARGRDVLAEGPERIDNEFLRRFPEYLEWRTGKRSRTGTGGEAGEPVIEEESAASPEERIELAHEEHQNVIEAEIVERLQRLSPRAFERLVLEVMKALDYGEPDHVGRSGDGGIDGVVTADALGFEKVYLQAKRYSRDHPVGASQVREFGGALDEHGTAKGVFVTTGRFTEAARKAAERSPKRIVLVDGATLARLMLEHRIGVRSSRTFELFRVDEDWFERLED